MSDIWKFIKAKPFFEKYLPDIKQPVYKILGKNTRGNPLSFTDEEKVRINQKLREMIKENKLL